MSDDVLFLSTDNVLTLSNFKNRITDAAITGATVTVVLYHADKSTEVTDDASPGVSWPVTMSDAGSGTYRATLPYTLSLNRKKAYFGKVFADGGSGLVSTWWKRLVCQERGD